MSGLAFMKKERDWHAVYVTEGMGEKKTERTREKKDEGERNVSLHINISSERVNGLWFQIVFVVSSVCMCSHLFVAPLSSPSFFNGVLLLLQLTG